MRRPSPDAPRAWPDGVADPSTASFQRRIHNRACRLLLALDTRGTTPPTDVWRGDAPLCRGISHDDRPDTRASPAFVSWCLQYQTDGLGGNGSGVHAQPMVRCRGEHFLNW